MHFVKKTFDLLKNKNNSVILVRYGLYSFGLLETLLLPKFLDATFYASFEYFKFIIFLFPQVLLGSYGGFVLVLYEEKRDLFEPLFKIGSLIILFSSFLLSSYFHNWYLFLPFTFLGLYVILEQDLKINHKYILVFLFKPLISIISLIVAVFIFSKEKYFIELSVEQLVCFVFTIAFFVWIVAIQRHIRSLHLLSIFKEFGTGLRLYFYMVRKYIWVALSGLLIMFLLFIERFIIKTSYTEYLAEYSLVYNISQIMALVLSVFGYISSVELGESLYSLSRSVLIQDFRKKLLAFLAFFAFFEGMVFLLSFFYQEFEELFWMTSILSFSKGLFYFIGIYTPIAIYQNLNFKMIKVLLKLVFVSTILSFTFSHFHFKLIFLLAVNFFTFLGYTIYAGIVIFNHASYVHK